MNLNNFDKNVKKNRSIERHDTASWCNGENKKDFTNAIIPFEFDVLDAKEWADENQK